MPHVRRAARKHIHFAAAALINAVWDLWAKVEAKPLWRLLAEPSPEETVAAIDFRYIEDALSPAETLSLLQEMAPSRAERIALMRENGLPAYTISVGWFGFSDDKVRRLCREALADGWTHFKLKVAAIQRMICVAAVWYGKRSAG